MILEVVNEQSTPNLSVIDRMILMLFDLGITNKKQIETISGWNEHRINDALKRIRKKGDGWLNSWQPRRGQPHCYALGKEGFKYARELRGEFSNGKHDGPPRGGQTWHFLGLNQILCRCIEAGLGVEQWLSGRESASWIYYQLSTGDSDPKIPIKPDAMMAVNGQWFLVEYDTGTETTVRLSEKFTKYLTLSQTLGMDLPLLFVTVSEKRVNTAEWTFQRALKNHTAKWDKVFFLTEGQEVELLRDWSPESFGTK